MIRQIRRSAGVDPSVEALMVQDAIERASAAGGGGRQLLEAPLFRGRSGAPRSGPKAAERRSLEGTQGAQRRAVGARTGLGLGRNLVSAAPCPRGGRCLWILICCFLPLSTDLAYIVAGGAKTRILSAPTSQTLSTDLADLAYIRALRARSGPSLRTALVAVFQRSQSASPKRPQTREREREVTERHAIVETPIPRGQTSEAGTRSHVFCVLGRGWCTTCTCTCIGASEWRRPKLFGVII